MKKILCIVCILCMYNNSFSQDKGFEKAIEINAGIGLDDYINYSFGANFIGGYRINSSFFIGAGVGYSYMDGLYYSHYEHVNKGEYLSYDSYEGRSNIQAFIRAKLNLTKSNISPFLLVDAGGTFGLTSNQVKMANGFTYEPAFGVDFKVNQKQTIYLMLGYKGHQYQYKFFNTTYGNAGEETLKTPSGTLYIHIGFKL